MHIAGQQLEGQLLYERQKALRATQPYPAAPMIIATNLQVPDNIGSVLRLADAAGSRRVIFIAATELDLQRVHKRARNCEQFIQWDVYTPEQFLSEVESLRPLVAVEITTESGNIFKAALPNPCAFMIGSERHGIPSAILAKCDYAVHIPVYGVNGSMNVTHALGIALFEWRRQQAHF